VSGGPFVPVSAGAQAAPRLELRGHTHDLRTRALVAAVVPGPRFGREAEVQAAVARAAEARADLADVSLEPRLVGPVARGPVPVCARVADLRAAAAAHAAGAALLLVPHDVVAAAVAEGLPVAVVVDDVAELAGAAPQADALGVPLAFDAGRRAEADAAAQEATALASGCRIVRTTDIRRTRRVVEVVAALLEARR
jgi:hypothetical protein